MSKKVMFWKYVNIFFAIFFYYVNRYHSNSFTIAAEKVPYIITEHPKVTLMNPRFFDYGNMTSQRYGRRNPFYYVGIHFNSLITIDYNVSIDFYFYEYLSNVYKRSFVEMHFDLCHMVHNDKFFGAPLKQGKMAKPCPWPPGPYNMYNMTIDVKVIPRGFPFRKGRIYCNLTSTTYKQTILGGYIDMEVKEYDFKRKTPKP